MCTLLYLCKQPSFPVAAMQLGLKEFLYGIVVLLLKVYFLDFLLLIFQIRSSQANYGIRRSCLEQEVLAQPQNLLVTIQYLPHNTMNILASHE